MNLLLTLNLSHGAALLELTQKDVAVNTQVPSQDFSKLIQKELEEHLFYEDDGVSCGLKSFTIEAYRILSSSKGKASKLEVETLVNGPFGTCSGYDTYPCYTVLDQIESDNWAAASTFCENGGSAE